MDPGPTKPRLPRATPAWAARTRRRIISSLGDKCSNCGSLDALELHNAGPPDKRHHGLGAKARTLWYLKRWRAGQLQLLCQACHRRAHASAV